ncbi:MAG: hypothetical protein QME81_05670 [bacterium]|nr:hypothetical protein [bacterium]
MENLKSTVAASTIPKALVEILSLLSAEEKMEFANSFNWNEFKRLKKAGKPEKARRIGDPKVYVQADSGGLDFEMPAIKVAEFVKLLIQLFVPSRIELFLQKRDEEFICTPDKFNDFLTNSRDALAEDYLMIEFGGNTLISGGGGCLGLTLVKPNSKLIKKIAEDFLQICGFEYHFRKNHFSAVVWETELEVEE